MERRVLRDDQWERIKDLLPGKASDRGVTAKDNRLFLEAVLWVARTGAPWRVRDENGLIDALGNPIAFTLTGAEQADISQALDLLEQAPDAGAVIADKGYDGDALVEHIESQHAEAIIPPRSNRKELRNYDRHRYKARNLVERFFNRLKQFRRVATRYEKLAKHFAAMVSCACIVLWLK